MPEKILIVDDDVDSLKLIGLMLQRNGYEVVAASAGNQAIAKALAERPNLIILDVMMPDMDGYEVTRRLRSEAATRDIPIIMFTAKTLIEDKLVGFEAGADDYLTKPTHPAELASRVRAILARNTARPATTTAAPSSYSIGVMGVKGGLGTTTIAINLAASLQNAGERPILVDLCLGIGTIGLTLGVGQTAGVATLLSKAAGEINERNIEGQLLTHQTGLRILSSSARPKEALQSYQPDAVAELIRALQKMSPIVICDLGSRLTPGISRAIREVDQLIIAVEPNKVALTMARELLYALESEGIGREKLNFVVINRTQSSLQTPWQEIEQTLGQEIRAIISGAPDLAFQAADAGMPMVIYKSTAIISSQLNKLAEDFRTRLRQAR